MEDFLNYLRTESVIEYFIDFYKYNKKNNIQNNILEEFIEKLDQKKYDIENTRDIKLIPNDVIGQIYEDTVNYKYRKKLGEFFTPVSVVDYILNAVGYNSNNEIEDRSLIDISCGSGSFLIRAIDELIKFFKRKFNKGNVISLTPNEAKYAINSIEKNISGVDLNPIACILCQINIQLALFGLYKIIIKQEKNYRFPVFNIQNSNALLLKESNKYDFVVGNPPYLFIRDIAKTERELIESSDFETKLGQYDLYQIFIELGIRLLKIGSLLGYIIPDSILVLSNRKLLRNYIYNNTKIKEIYHVGSKFDDIVVSNVILILQKENNINQREENKVQISLPAIEGYDINNFTQKKIRDWNYEFLINLNEQDSLILNYLKNNFPKLKNLISRNDFKIKINRGVELGKNGKIIYCNVCQKYLPLPKKELTCRKCNNTLNNESIENIIFDKIPLGHEKDFKLFLYIINRYQNKEYKYININKNGIDYKNLDIYKNRIIIRQLSQDNLICATYDKQQSLTSQSCYNLKIEKSNMPEFNYFYLLGILNSKLLSYYFLKSFGSYKKLFPRILLEKIKELPIKIPETLQEKELAIKISDLVKLLLENKKFSDKKISIIQGKIDTLVFELFQILNDKKNYILNCMQQKLK